MFCLQVAPKHRTNAEQANLLNLFRYIFSSLFDRCLKTTMEDTGGPEGVTVASKVHFAELCGLLEKISKTQGNDKKKRILKDFIDQWRQSHNALHGADKDSVGSCPSLAESVLSYVILEFVTRSCLKGQNPCSNHEIHVLFEHGSYLKKPKLGPDLHA